MDKKIMPLDIGFFMNNPINFAIKNFLGIKI